MSLIKTVCLILLTLCANLGLPAANGEAFLNISMHFVLLPTQQQNVSEYFDAFRAAPTQW
jgi:hypothetical protein